MNGNVNIVLGFRKYNGTDVDFALRKINRSKGYSNSTTMILSPDQIFCKISSKHPGLAKYAMKREINETFARIAFEVKTEKHGVFIINLLILEILNVRSPHTDLNKLPIVFRYNSYMGLDDAHSYPVLSVF